MHLPLIGRLTGVSCNIFGVSRNAWQVLQVILVDRGIGMR